MCDVFEISEEAIEIPSQAQDVDLSAEVEKWIIRCSKLQDRYDDYQRRTLAERRALLLGLLEIVDALERIIEYQPDVENAAQTADRLHRNVKATRKLLSHHLSTVGVRPMTLVSTMLDPSIADVEGCQREPNLCDETVVTEIVHGYWWNDAVLRRANVIVSRST